MSLRARVLTGLKWAAIARVLVQTANWCITLVVIRLLTPGDYGLLAMAGVFLSIVAMFAEAGLGSALIQSREADEATVRAVFGAVILVNSTLYVIIFGAAPLVAAYFGEERLVALMRVLGLQMVLGILGVVPYAVLLRALDFRRLSMIGVCSNVLGGLTTLALALSGHGVWSIVLGQIAAQIVSLTAVNRAARVFPRPDFSLSHARGAIAYGWKVTGSRLLWSLYTQADVFIAGKLLGRDLVGLYSVSMHLASLPLQKITSILNAVSFPAFATLRDDRPRAALYVLKAVRLTGFVGFPVAWGIAAVSPEAVRVVLGATWEEAVVPLQLISLVVPLRMVSALLQPATDGIGRPDVGLKSTLFAFVLMPPAFYLGCRWGVAGLSAAWLACYPLVAMQNVHRSAQALGTTALAIWGAAARPLGASGIVVAAVSALRAALPAGVPEPWRLALLVACGVAAYVAASFALNRQGIAEIRDLVRRS
ncbi:MAG: lipopolysaccharide biosynthesis protein [Burkholderiales bacterium]|nr:lipopolysaccharide biosynthesis protein [Burkholderiales bacterium]